MLKIASNENSFVKNYSDIQNPTFKAKIPDTNLVNKVPWFVESSERKLIRLYNEIGNMINEARVDMRKKKLPLNDISFITRSNKDGLVTLKPVCNSKNNAFAVQFENSGIIERIFVDKDSKCNFIYEKSVKTDHGSYVTRTFNSKTDNDSVLTGQINEKLNKYLPVFINNYNKIKAPSYLK